MIILVAWTGVNQFFWLLQPHLMTYKDSSLHARVNVLMHSGLSFGTVLLVAVLGIYLQKQHESPSIIFRLWLNTIILGIITAVLGNIFLSGGNTETSYDTILPMLRNAAPIIGGVMLGYLIGKGIDQLSISSRQVSAAVIIGLLIIPSTFKLNLFGWQTPNMLLYGLIFELGWELNYLNADIKKTTKWALISVSAMAIFEFLMPLLAGGDSQLWYAGTNSIVIIIPALVTAKLLSQLIGINLNLATVSSIIIVFESPTIAAGLSKLIDPDNQGTFHTMIVAIILTGVLMFYGWVWSNVLKLSIPQVISKYLDQLVKKSPIEQAQYLESVIIEYWPQELMVGLSYLLSLVMMSMVNPLMSDNNGAQVFTPIFLLEKWQGMLLLTAIIISCVMFTLWVIIRRYWVTLGLVGASCLGFSIANMMKISSRQEPILPADLSSLSAGGELIKLADKKLLLAAGVLIGILVLVIIFLEIKFPVKPAPSLVVGLIAIACLGIIWGSAYHWNEDHSTSHRVVGALGDDPQFINQLDGAKRNGPIIQFMNNLDIEIMKKPAGYSKETMEDLHQRYLQSAAQINQTRTNSLKDQTIIFNLSESFANPDRVPSVKLKNSPIPKIKNIMKNGTSGLMMSSGYGGGTANMEWMTLTGFNLSFLLPTLQVPYTQLVPNQQNPQTIVQHFTYSMGIHPYVATYYNRISNYQKFGFDKFEYLGSKYPIKHQKKIDRSDDMSDDTSYANLYDQIKARPQGQFINLMTMQNHMPYDLNDYNLIQKFNAKSLSVGTQANMLNNYSTRLHYTDDAVDTFIKKIDQLNQPVTIVFYGDHLPGLYGNDMNVDNIKLHQTDYFIYSNKYAREHFNAQKKITSGPTKVTDPQNFIPMVAAQTNSKVNWYYALLTNVWQQLPAMSLNQSDNAGNNRTLLTDQDGNQVSFKSLSPQQKQLYHDYQLVQYDMTAGHHYLKNYFTKTSDDN